MNAMLTTYIVVVAFVIYVMEPERSIAGSARELDFSQLVTRYLVRENAVQYAVELGKKSARNVEGVAQLQSGLQV